MVNSRVAALTIILNTFFVCLLAYFIEYKFFYNQIVSIFGTTILSKIFAIIAIFVAMYFLETKFKNIGYIFKAKKIIGGIISPTIILTIGAILSFLIIKLLAVSQGVELAINFEIAVSSLEAKGAASPTYISFIVEIISILISSIMLETLLRGLILQTANKYLRFYAANTINVGLSIIWHIALYVFFFIFQNMSLITFISSLIFVSIIYGASAIRKSLYMRATGSIWACIVDCVVSLLLIRNLSFTINLPSNFTPTGLLENLLYFMSSKSTNSTYATIIFLCLLNIFSLIIMVIYCHRLKKKAREKYLSKINQKNDLVTD